MQNIHTQIEQDKIKFENEHKLIQIDHNNKMNFINMDYQNRINQIYQNNYNYNNNYYNNMNLNQAPPSYMNYSGSLPNDYNLIPF